MPVVGALAALDVIALALLALIMAVGFFPMFRPLLSGILSEVPVIGGWIASRVDILLIGAYVGAVSWTNVATAPLTDAVGRYWLATYSINQQALQAIINLTQKVVMIRFDVIPAVTQQLWVLMSQLYNLTVSLINAQAAQQQQYSVALYWQAVRFTVQELGAEQAFAQQLAAQGQQFTLGQIAQVVSYDQQLAAQLLSDAQGLTLDAERYAAALAAQLVAFTQAAVGDAELLAERIGVDGAEYARALQRQALDFASGAAAAAFADAAALTAALAVTVTAIEDSPCMRFCAPLGDLGQLLQQLVDLGLAALLVSLAAELARDPRGTAATLDQLIGGPIREVAAVAALEAGQAAGGLDSFTRFGGPARAA